MDYFEFGKMSARLDYLSEMKKADFDKKYEKHIDVKEGWKKLQSELKKYNKGLGTKSK